MKIQRSHRHPCDVNIATRASVSMNLYRCVSTVAVAIASAVLTTGVHAQSATIYGSLGNFDVVNNTGEDACGFEVELEGMQSSAITTFTAQRYGGATVTPYTNGAISGMRVRWASLDCSSNKTIAHPPGTPFGGTCYQWNAATYPTAGCEHFGVHYAYTNAITRVTSRWLVRDPANPGNYVPHDPPMAVAFPSYTWAPPVNAGNPPVVVAEVEAPEPPEAPERYGNAQWMKVFVRQLPHTVTLDQLVTDNPTIVPMDATQLEVNWQLIQAEPLSGSNGNRRRNRSSGSSNLDPTTRSIVRRYEMYEYTGAVDPVTNEALCADLLLCNAPSAGELGDFISAQMTAVDVQGDNLVVAVAGDTGSGRIESSDKAIACGNKCVAAYNAGTAVSITARPDSGSTFQSWTGACAGMPATCTVAITGAVRATANFAKASSGSGGGGNATSGATLKVSVSNSGSVTSNVGGINCGSVCSATYPANTSVTLTAIPPAGKSFSGWSGACAGSNPVCTITMSSSTSVKASFSK